MARKKRPGADGGQQASMPQGRRGFSPAGRKAAESLLSRTTAFAASLSGQAPVVTPAAGFARDLARRHTAPPLSQAIQDRTQRWLLVDVARRYALTTMALPRQDLWTVTGHQELFRTLAVLGLLEPPGRRRSRIAAAGTSAIDRTAPEGIADTDGLSWRDTAEDVDAEAFGIGAPPVIAGMPAPLTFRPALASTAGALSADSVADDRRPAGFASYLTAVAAPLGEERQALGREVAARRAWRPDAAAAEQLPIGLGPSAPVEEVPARLAPRSTEEPEPYVPTFTSLPEVFRMVAGVQRKAQPGRPMPGAAGRSQAMSFAMRSAGISIEPAPRRVLERVLGADFADVRVHTGTEAAAAATTLSAQAFTVGRDLYFAPGAYQPGTPAGLALLGHELTHAMQQHQGPARRTMPGLTPLEMIGAVPSPGMVDRPSQARPGVTGASFWPLMGGGMALASLGGTGVPPAGGKGVGGGGFSVVGTGGGNFFRSAGWADAGGAVLFPGASAAAGGYSAIGGPGMIGEAVDSRSPSPGGAFLPASDGIRRDPSLTLAGSGPVLLPYGAGSAAAPGTVERLVVPGAASTREFAADPGASQFAMPATPPAASYPGMLALTLLEGATMVTRALAEGLPPSGGAVPLLGGLGAQPILPAAAAQHAFDPGFAVPSFGAALGLPGAIPLQRGIADIPTGREMPTAGQPGATPAAPYLVPPVGSPGVLAGRFVPVAGLGGAMIARMAGPAEGLIGRVAASTETAFAGGMAPGASGVASPDWSSAAIFAPQSTVAAEGAAYGPAATEALPGPALAALPGASQTRTGESPFQGILAGGMLAFSRAIGAAQGDQTVAAAPAQPGVPPLAGPLVTAGALLGAGAPATVTMSPAAGTGVPDLAAQSQGFSRRETPAAASLPPVAARSMMIVSRQVGTDMVAAGPAGVVGPPAESAMTAGGFTALPEMLSLASAVQRKADGTIISSLQRRALALEQAARSTGRPLELGTRRTLERALGAGFADVQVHTGGEAAAAASTIGAHAFALGRNIYFAPGAFQPTTPTGLALLGHELTHTMQQQSIPQRKALPGWDDGGDADADAEPAHLEDQALHTETRLLNLFSSGPSSLAAQGGSVVSRMPLSQPWTMAPGMSAAGGLGGFGAEGGPSRALAVVANAGTVPPAVSGGAPIARVPAPGIFGASGGTLVNRFTGVIPPAGSEPHLGTEAPGMGPAPVPYLATSQFGMGGELGSASFLADTHGGAPPDGVPGLGITHGNSQPTLANLLSRRATGDAPSLGNMQGPMGPQVGSSMTMAPQSMPLVVPQGPVGALVSQSGGAIARLQGGPSDQPGGAMSAQAAPGGPPGAVASADDQSTGPGGGDPNSATSKEAHQAADMDEIAEQVMQRLKRQLSLEHERAGGFMAGLLR